MLHPAALSMKAAMSSTDSVFFSLFTFIFLSVYLIVRFPK